MLRINRKEQSGPAHCSWYVFILCGVAIHLTVCTLLCVFACVWGPEANATRLCIHYPPHRQQYGVIAHGDGVNVYHRERFSWSKITAETERVVPVSAGPDKLSPSATDALVLCNVNLWGANYLCVTGAAACAQEDLSAWDSPVGAAAVCFSPRVWWWVCKYEVIYVIQRRLSVSHSHRERGHTRSTGRLKLL